MIGCLAYVRRRARAEGGGRRGATHDYFKIWMPNYKSASNACKFIVISDQPLQPFGCTIGKSHLWACSEAVNEP